ncbi:hypothetical protein Hdeb2414_s0005g00162451 [Helianthus debilis subsp. tardiflorus]
MYKIMFRLASLKDLCMQSSSSGLIAKRVIFQARARARTCKSSTRSTFLPIRSRIALESLRIIYTPTYYSKLLRFVNQLKGLTI